MRRAVCIIHDVPFLSCVVSVSVSGFGKIGYFCFSFCIIFSVSLSVSPVSVSLFPFPSLTIFAYSSPSAEVSFTMFRPGETVILGEREFIVSGLTFSFFLLSFLFLSVSLFPLPIPLPLPLPLSFYSPPVLPSLTFTFFFPLFFFSNSRTSLGLLMVFFSPSLGFTSAVGADSSFPKV